MICRLFGSGFLLLLFILLFCSTMTGGDDSLTTTTTTTTKATAPNANLFCFQCSSRRNHKDNYADPTDCHFYYQCFYLNNTAAFGYRRHCPIGTYWRDQVLQCLPEGPIPCQDKCFEDEINTRGCYAGTGCRQFFTCSNTASYAGCCPVGTAFNPFNCNCEHSARCHDPCTIRGPTEVTTPVPPAPVNDTVCKDAYGNSIMTVVDDPSLFKLIGANGVVTAAQRCPPNLKFDLLTCTCNMFLPGNLPRITQYRKALLWMPFDTDTQDQSISHYATFSYGVLSRDGKVSATTGGGSLLLKGGHLSIPGLKTQDLRNKVSMCLFFRCETGPSENPYLCGVGGGLLSNNKDAKFTEYTAVIGVQRFNRFQGYFSFWRPIGAKEINAALHTADNGWNQVCVTYDSFALRLYINAVLVDEQYIGGFFSIAHCPYVVGSDQAMGNFTGHIDDVLITPFDMNEDEIYAHFTGNRGFLVSQGFFLP